MMADMTRFDQYMPLALGRTTLSSPVLNGVSLPGGVVPFLADDLRFALSQLAVLEKDDALTSIGPTRRFSRR